MESEEARKLIRNFYLDVVSVMKKETQRGVKEMQKSAVSIFIALVGRKPTRDEADHLIS
jgi:hypothetical protein